MADTSLLLLRMADFLRTRKGGIAADAAAGCRPENAGAAQSLESPGFPWAAELETMLQQAADVMTQEAKGEEVRASKLTTGAGELQTLLAEAWLVRSSFARTLNRFQVEQSNKSSEFSALQMTEAKQEALTQFDRQISASLARWIAEDSGSAAVPALAVRDVYDGMRAIQGLLQIATDLIPPQARGHVAAAVQQLSRLAASTQELLKGDAIADSAPAGITPALPPPPKVRDDLAVAPLDVGSFVRALAEAARPVAQKKGLRLEAMCNPGPAILKTDAARLHRAATLLVDYAVSFTDHGEVSIVSGLGESGQWTLEISDSSAGVPTHRLARLLQGVGRAPDDAATVGDATIGIALARDLAQLLGGSLTATSEPGEGNCFRLSLPIV